MPVFAHVDKDMAEIGMLQQVWNPKIQLCWWHLRKATKERLAKNKLATTPYNVQRAHEEFAFINPKFIPPGSADPNEYEGGTPDSSDAVNQQCRESPNTISIRISIPSSLQMPNTPKVGMDPDARVLSDQLNTHLKKPSSTAQSVGDKLIIKIPGKARNTKIEGGQQSTTQAKQSASTHIDAEDTRTFCPLEYCDDIINMMEQHFCAHPLIPGYSHPSPQGIREWAVKQMYEFCVKHHLYEAWAYLWENWYRNGQWKLWAHSVHAEIPRLKTTMILESQ